MIEPQIPKNETARLHALRASEILDTSHEETFGNFKMRLSLQGES